MCVLRSISHLIQVAVLCIAVVNMHDVAAAAYFDADHQCLSISQPGQGIPDGMHNGPSCTKTQCCPTLPEPSSNHSRAAAEPRNRHIDETNPFLLVRALYPPPKRTLF